MQGILHFAVGGHIECLRQLHSEKMVFGVRDESGSTPLHAAMETSQIECASFLIDRTGAELRARCAADVFVCLFGVTSAIADGIETPCFPLNNGAQRQYWEYPSPSCCFPWATARSNVPL